MNRNGWNNKKRIKRNGDGRYIPPDLRPFKIAQRPQQLGEFPMDIPPEYDLREELPIDLYPRVIRDRTAGPVPSGPPMQGIDLSNQFLEQISYHTNIMASTLVLDRGLIGRRITVGVTPTRIIQAQFLRGYIVMNPSLIVGGTAAGEIKASSLESTAGNTQADPLGVANYRDLHLFLDVTAVTGATPTLDIYAQALDPVTLKWADTQLLYSGISTTGTFYANPGSLGLATDFAIRWEIAAASSFTFSVNFALKEGLPGTGAGVGKTLFLGNSGVTVESGFPLLEGQSRPFFLKDNTELWAVANTSLDLSVFEL